MYFILILVLTFTLYFLYFSFNAINTMTVTTQWTTQSVNEMKTKATSILRGRSAIT